MARRHQVDLVAFVQEPLIRPYYESLEKGLDDCRRELEGFCHSVTFLPIESTKSFGGKRRLAFTSMFSQRCYSISWLLGPNATAAVSGFAASNDYDLAHFDTVALAPFRSHFGNVPCTLGHHNVESHMMLRRAELNRNPLTKAYYYQEGVRLRAYERSIAADFRTHITCSELDAIRLRENCGDVDTSVIPNGVDVNYLKPTYGPERPESLIFIGTLNWYPNVSAVLFLLQEVWPLVLSRRPNARLDIVGANAPEVLRAAATSLRGVTLHGYVPDFRQMVDSASIYVCPITDGGGTKLKILDALAMAKCIVSHPIACEGIDVEDGVSVVLATSATEFASAIESMLADKDARDRIGRAARELALDRYSFETIGEKLVSKFEALAR